MEILTQEHIDELNKRGFDFNPTQLDTVWIERKYTLRKADWKFLNKLLKDKNILFEIQFDRGDGDKGRSKEIWVNKKYFHSDIKFPLTTVELKLKDYLI